MPTETTAPRLIDANALLARMNDKQDQYEENHEVWLGIAEAIEIVESAPTVDISELQEKAWKYDELCK